MNQKLKFVAQPKTVSVTRYHFVILSPLTPLYIYIDCWVPIQASHNSSNVEYPPCTDFNCTVADRLDIILLLFWYLHHFLNVL